MLSQAQKNSSQKPTRPNAAPRSHSALTLLAVVSAAVLTAACATTPSNQPVWRASASVDPITSVSRCVVSPPDTDGRGAYSRTGYLYPFVENNSELGLLVGVSSGGPVRMPPGDIVWRVDAEPHRTLRAAQTPSMGASGFDIDTSAMSPEVRQSLEASMAASAGMMSSIQNGITAVDGAEAEEMLAEMRGGSALIYRAASASQNLGLTSSSTQAVGRYTSDGHEPFPLDESFENALAQCGL